MSMQNQCILRRSDTNNSFSFFRGVSQQAIRELQSELEQLAEKMVNLEACDSVEVRLSVVLLL